MPLVSVLTTSYNRADFISEAIESVLASTLEDFEYIIVDDRSTDDTYEIAKSYEARDPRVRVYQNEQNLGDYPNRNQAASYASGTYLKYLDSDDIMYPHCLDVMVRCMQQYPEAGLGLVKLHTQERPLPITLRSAEVYQENFEGNGVFGNSPGSAIIHRDRFESLGRFSGRRYIGDNECWFKLAAHYPVVYIPGFLGWDRKHEGQESTFDEVKYALLRDAVAFDALNSTDCPLEESHVERFKRNLSRRQGRLVANHWLRRRSLQSGLEILRNGHCNLTDVILGTIFRY